MALSDTIGGKGEVRRKRVKKGWPLHFKGTKNVRKYRTLTRAEKGAEEIYN
jgi:hypothetical protein